MDRDGTGVELMRSREASQDPIARSQSCKIEKTRESDTSGVVFQRKLGVSSRLEIKVGEEPEKKRRMERDL